MPVVIVPQFFLSGVLIPRDQMPRILELISNVLPLSYAVTALQEISQHVELYQDFWRDIAVLVVCAVVILVVAALSMPRRTY